GSSLVSEGADDVPKWLRGRGIATPRRRRRPMDATELLKEDHDTVRDLLKKYEAAGDRAYQTKKGLFEEIKDELEIHSKIEEKIFYPAVKKLRSADAEEIVDEAIEEHAIVKRLLEELDGLKPQDERFDAKMKVLKDNVEHQ